MKNTPPATSLLSYEVRCENDTFCLPDLLMKSTVQPDNFERGIVYGLTKGIDIAIEVRKCVIGTSFVGLPMLFDCVVGLRWGGAEPALLF